VLGATRVVREPEAEDESARARTRCERELAAQCAHDPLLIASPTPAPARIWIQSHELLKTQLLAIGGMPAPVCHLDRPALCVRARAR